MIRSVTLYHVTGHRHTNCVHTLIHLLYTYCLYIGHNGGVTGTTHGDWYKQVSIRQTSTPAYRPVWLPGGGVADVDGGTFDQLHPPSRHQPQVGLGAMRVRTVDLHHHPDARSAGPEEEVSNLNCSRSNKHAVVLGLTVIV